MRTKSPTDKDAQRIAERIYLSYGKSIKDQRTFDAAFDAYMQGAMTPGVEAIRGQVFNALRERKPSIVEGDLFKEAGGKNFKQDRRTTAKRVVRTAQQYRQEGSRRVDLAGYDTKPAGKQFEKLKRKYAQVGTIRGKTVRIAQDTIMIKGKSVIRYRDARGRFAKRIS
jgi:hypothetical protein